MYVVVSVVVSVQIRNLLTPCIDNLLSTNVLCLVVSGYLLAIDPTIPYRYRHTSLTIQVLTPLSPSSALLIRHVC